MLITSLYGMKLPETKDIKLREKKVAEAIASMGERWLLAVEVERKNG